MATFIATYANARGEERHLQLQAITLQDAKRDLRRRGIRPISLEPAEKGNSATATATKAIPVQPSRRTAGPNPDERAASRQGFNLQALLEAKPGIREKALFASKLSALVSAGVPIVRSLALMSAQQRMPLFKRALESITAEVNQGSSLGDAMRLWPTVFDRLSIAMVEAGEAGGVLDETLKRLAKLLEETSKLRSQIKGAMGYPVAVLTIAILVFLGMTIFLIPTFAGIFEELGAELPLFTQLIVELSKLLRSPFSMVLAGGGAAGTWLCSRAYASHKGRRRVDAWLLQLPLFGDLMQKSATAQFCRTFSSLSKAGVPILLSLEIVRETAGNSVISDAISASRSDISEGIPLSVSLARKRVFPEMAVSMLSIGEEAGNLETMLAKVADFYEDEVNASVKALTSMLEPIMIVIVGGIVGSILLAMYLPMFSVFDKIK